tara:strand:- start:4448 stop:5323 length:876 start_codon:yes stop_codon:yes gene_type:complete
MSEYILEHRSKDGRCISDAVIFAFDEQDALIRYALAKGFVAGTDRVCIGVKNTHNFIGEYGEILAAIEKGVITWPEQELLILELESPDECVELLLPVMSVHSPNLYEAFLDIDIKEFQKNGFEYVRIRRFLGDKNLHKRIDPDFSGGGFYHLMGDRLVCVTDYDRALLHKNVSKGGPSYILERTALDLFMETDWIQAHEAADRNNDKIWEEFPEAIWMHPRKCSKCSKRYDAQITTVKVGRCPYCDKIFVVEWVYDRLAASFLGKIIFLLLMVGVLGIALKAIWNIIRPIS